MKFRFSLQKALDWTEVEESALRMEIARLLKEAERLTARRAELESNLERLLGGQLSLEWAPYRAQKVPSDAREMRELEGKIRERRNEIEFKKVDLNRVLMKRKGLESLRGKRLGDFRMQETRREQKRLDDNYQILKARVKAE